MRRAGAHRRQRARGMFQRRPADTCSHSAAGSFCAHGAALHRQQRRRQIGGRDAPGSERLRVRERRRAGGTHVFAKSCTVRHSLNLADISTPPGNAASRSPSAATASVAHRDGSVSQGAGRERVRLYCAAMLGPASVPEGAANPARALLWALLTALSASPAAVLIHWGARSADPFLFNAVVVAVVAVGLWPYLRTGPEPVGEAVAAVVAVVKSLPQRGPRGWVTMAALALGPLNYGLFALAAGMVGVVVTAVLYESWLVWMTLLLATKVGHRTRSIDRGTFLWMLGAFAGAAVIVSSQVQPAGLSGRWWPLGLLLALSSAATAGSLLSETILVGHHSIETMAAGPAQQQKQMAVMVAAIMTAEAAGSASSALIGIFSGGSLTPRAVVAAAAMGIALTVTSVAARRAHFHSSGLGINAVLSSQPAMSMGWLVAAGVPLQHMATFVAGVAALIVSNLAIQSRAATR